MKRRIRLTRRLFGSAPARRYRAFMQLEADTGSAFTLTDYDPIKGTYTIHLPTDEYLTIDKKAVAGFLAGIYACATATTSLRIVDTLPEALPELVETDD